MTEIAEGEIENMLEPEIIEYSKLSVRDTRCTREEERWHHAVLCGLQKTKTYHTQGRLS